MKKKEPRFTALYAAPGFFRPGKAEKEPENGVKEPERPDYPASCAEPEADPAVISGVYGCPTPAEAGPKEAPQPDYPANNMNEPDPAAFMCVYAGPDWFAARSGRGGLGAELPDEGGKAPEEPEEPASEETEEERIARLTEQYKNDPPAICGLVQADPEALRRNTGFMNMNMCMGMGETPRFCSECGTPAKQGDKFCRSCGAKLLR